MSPAAAKTPIRVDRRVLQRATSALCRSDPDLASIEKRFGKTPLWSRPPGFSSLTLMILEQQVSLASGRAAFERLAGAAGEMTPPRVAALSESAMRRAGLTRQKAAYCHNLASRVLDGSFRLRRVARADDDAARALLCELKGVGPWTADVYLLFALRRPDIWPIGDLALDKAIAELKGLPAKADAQEGLALAEGWRPWRSVAARLLWHFYLSTRGRDSKGTARAR